MPDFLTNTRIMLPFIFGNYFKIAQNKREPVIFPMNFATFYKTYILQNISEQLLSMLPNMTRLNGLKIIKHISPKSSVQWSKISRNSNNFLEFYIISNDSRWLWWIRYPNDKMWKRKKIFFSKRRHETLTSFCRSSFLAKKLSAASCNLHVNSWENF